MILPQFEYKRARSVADAVALYRKERGKAFYLAGGTDLIPLVKLRLREPKAVIDLKGIEDLKIIASRGGSLSVGANVTLFDLKKDPVIAAHFPALVESLERRPAKRSRCAARWVAISQGTRCLEYTSPLNGGRPGFLFQDGRKGCNVVRGAKACFANYCSDNAPRSSVRGAGEAHRARGERTVKRKAFSPGMRGTFCLGGGRGVEACAHPPQEDKGSL
jgi:hypothetical protein